jgi:hypothetical protein
LVVIQCVGRILEPYDTDKRYSVFGYGARVRQPDGSFSGPVQHCIQLMGGEVSGVDGILQVRYFLFGICIVVIHDNQCIVHRLIVVALAI